MNNITSPSLLQKTENYYKQCLENHKKTNNENCETLALNDLKNYIQHLSERQFSQLKMAIESLPGDSRSSSLFGRMKQSFFTHKLSAIQAVREVIKERDTEEYQGIGTEYDNKITGIGFKETNHYAIVHTSTFTGKSNTVNCDAGYLKRTANGATLLSFGDGLAHTEKSRYVAELFTKKALELMENGTISATASKDDVRAAMQNIYEECANIQGTAEMEGERTGLLIAMRIPIPDTKTSRIFGFQAGDQALITYEKGTYRVIAAPRELLYRDFEGIIWGQEGFPLKQKDITGLDAAKRIDSFDLHIDKETILIGTTDGFFNGAFYEKVDETLRYLELKKEAEDIGRAIVQYRNTETNEGLIAPLIQQLRDVYTLMWEMKSKELESNLNDKCRDFIQPESTPGEIASLLASVAMKGTEPFRTLKDPDGMRALMRNGMSIPIGLRELKDKTVNYFQGSLDDGEKKLLRNVFDHMLDRTTERRRRPSTTIPGTMDEVGIVRTSEENQKILQYLADNNWNTSTINILKYPLDNDDFTTAKQEALRDIRALVLQDQDQDQGLLIKKI